MKIKTLKSIKTLLRVVRNSMPILECFSIDREYISYTNLEIRVKVRHLFPIKSDSEPIVVNSDHFIQRMSHIRAPFFISCNKNENITFEQPGSSSTLKNETKSDFPVEINNTDLRPLFSISAKEIEIMDIASEFVASDELRPVMAQVCVGSHFVVSSDAHILYYRKIGITENIEVLFDKRVIKLMRLFPTTTFKIGKTTGKFLCAESDDMIIWWRSDINDHLTVFSDTAVRSLYPNWRTVLPTVEHTVILPVKETIEALDAIKFAANQASWLVVSKIQGNTMNVSCKDIDFDISASETVNIINPDNAEIEFGMKVLFLRRILKCLLDEGHIQITMGFKDNTRAFIFQEQILLMPMMISQYIE